jgi:dTDP-4-dehydrorhamnose reductase
MKVVIFGRNGQVGTELLRQPWPSDYDVVPLGRDDIDLTNTAALRQRLADEAPAVIINAAAYTAVDKAEDEHDVAYAVNASAVDAMAAAARDLDATLVHISTDYVFDGSKDGAYFEDDATKPLGVYGRSKLAGETAALSADGALVLRTSWVYSAHGGNFVKTMRRLAGERDELGVVADQIGCPTSAADIASTILTLTTAGLHTAGIFNVTTGETATWWDMATEAIALAGHANTTTVNKLTTAQYPTPAERPANSVLNADKLQAVYGVSITPWRQALTSVSAELDQAVLDQ